MSFQAGALVRARGLEWVVLPESTEEPIYDCNVTMIKEGGHLTFDFSETERRPP
jgi:hypothetical protein